MTALTHVLLVGTMHFVSRKDLVRYDVFDVASPRMQADIADLVGRLARYDPTKVVLELAYAESADINDRYAAFRRGEHELDHGEAEQVGFRLAARLGHERVYPVNIMHRWWEPALDSLIDNVPDVAERWERYRAEIASGGERANERMRTLTLVEHLAASNADARSKGLRDYLTVYPRLVDGRDYAGADMTGNWYHRNVRIYANILRSCEPGDRLLVLYGGGHIAPLAHFMETSGEFVLDDVLPYLQD